MAMADIARQQLLRGDAEDGAVSLSSIADRQRISLAYLEQLFLRLRRAGLVESERGRSGGYRLARPAAEMTVAEIMLAVEEGVRMTRCHGEQATPCLAGHRCITHGLWQALGEAIDGFLSGVTLQQVAEGGPNTRRTSGDAPSVLFNGGVAR
jgi:Rrf2 family protein